MIRGGQPAEFIIGTDGSVRLTHLYQHCEDFPEPLVLTAAAQLAENRALRGNVRVFGRS